MNISGYEKKKKTAAVCGATVFIFFILFFILAHLQSYKMRSVLIPLVQSL
jgi:cytochrome c1